VTGGASASRRDWIGLMVLALPCALYSMDLTVLDLAVPALVADLRPSSTQLLWIIDSYGFVLAGSLITMGALGDRIGRRRLLLAGAAGFGAVSVLASLATTVPQLIAARAVLGLAGATIAPSTLSLIHAMFRAPRERAIAIGVWTAAFSAGGLLGPVLGGAVLVHASWRAAFWIGVPAMAALLALGRSFLPEVKSAAHARFDLRGAALSIAAIAATVYGVKAFARGDVREGVLAALTGGALGAWFVRRQRRIAHPLVDLALLRAPALAAAIATYMLAIFVVFGFYTATAQHLQLVVGLSPLAAGLCLVPCSLGFVIGSLLTPLVARVVQPATTLAVGLAVAACALAAVACAGQLPVLLAGTFVLALGLSPVAPLASAIVLASAPAEHAGTAAGVSETGAELGGALGIALLGSLAAAAYRTHAGAIGDSLADAVARHPAPAALAAARSAFERGFTLTAGVGAMLLAATSVLVLRHVRPR
jgi:MFS transporter, DHA2 family, multidrug resistance protein